jgi:hypothetical protein
MDTHCRMCYNMRHETLWNSSTTGITETTCRGLVEGGQNVSICGCNAKRIIEFGCALGSKLSERWKGGAPTKASPRTTTSIIASAETQAVAPVGARPAGRRIFHGFVDSATDKQIDRETFRSPLSSWPCVADNDELKMDMAEARTSCRREKRSSHCPVEETQVAQYKKKPENLEPISHFSTKVDFSSSLTSVRRGHPLDRLLSSATLIGGHEFLLSPPSPYPQGDIGLDCISVFIPAPLQGWKSLNSCVISYAISQDPSCFCGMEELFISGSLCKTSSINTAASTFIGFQRMPRNLTRMSLFGQKQNGISQTALQRMFQNSAEDAVNRSIASETRNNFSVLVSRPRIYRGLNNYIRYLCETQ